MAQTTQVLEYKCPNCGAGLPFQEESQKMTCQYCDSSFDLDEVVAYNDKLMEKEAAPISWDDTTKGVGNRGN